MKSTYMVHDMPFVVGIMNETSVAKAAREGPLIRVNSYKSQFRDEVLCHSLNRCTYACELSNDFVF